MRRIKCFWVEPTGQDTPAGHMYPNQPIFKRADTGEEFPYLNCRGDDRAFGAMFALPWLDEYGHIPDPKNVDEYNYHIDWVKLAKAAGTPRFYQPTDGKIIGVVTPGGTWIIDSRCRNCGKPTDNEHHCWVRHGAPPLITVDKDGNTCPAGGGSIQCSNYHGFLRNGYLED